jgi:ParB family chromosome partitioning protein
MPTATLERRATTNGRTRAAAVEIQVADISPWPTNPRHAVDRGSLDELVASLAACGLLQPVVVRPRGAGFELIAGHRRVEAAQVLGWTRIAAVVRDEADDEAYTPDARREPAARGSESWG